MRNFKNLKTDRSIFLKNYLIKNYSIKSKENIIKDLGLSWNYIQKMVCLFDIKRDFREFKYSFSLKKFLCFDNISCYWLGFILADGHISKVKNIQINLAIKDKEHIYKLEKYIGHKISIIEYKTKIRATIQDRPTINEISKIFKWETNKTKNPPIIPEFINNNKLFSLIIGFIDGDGTINKNGNVLRIKCDLCWKNILNYFYYSLTNENKNFNDIGNCSIIYICKTEILKDIKKKSIELNLPILDRKWNRVDLDKIIRYEKTKIKKNKILELLKKEIKDIDIVNKTGSSRSLVYKIKKEYERSLKNV